MPPLTTKIHTVYVDKNQLTRLNDIPESVETLECHDNLIREISETIVNIFKHEHGRLFMGINPLSEPAIELLKKIVLLSANQYISAQQLKSPRAPDNPYSLTQAG